ncbi:enoyl-CoA hydratase-related protein, partial [Jatrophihabitans endophyticus]|uniref:enoyl-CoA hydratase-related protein n=1 Tax=Jatrophihabitans endophyticus TaxID=1206085 RepID=UPI0019E5967B
PSFASYLLYSGERVSAEHALRVGLIDRVEDADALGAAVGDFAMTICSRSQVSVQGSKAIIAEIVSGADEAGEDARRLTFDAVNSADYREGVEAFLAKRPPRFTTT